MSSELLDRIAKFRTNPNDFMPTYYMGLIADCQSQIEALTLSNAKLAEHIGNEISTEHDRLRLRLEAAERLLRTIAKNGHLTQGQHRDIAAYFNEVKK